MERSQNSDSYRRMLAGKLRTHRSEIEQDICDRIAAIGESAGNASYATSRATRKLVHSALEHGISSLELGERRPCVLPPTLSASARNAAWMSISLETLLMRYVAGYSLFRDVLLREAEPQTTKHPPYILRAILRSTDVQFERMLKLIGAEYQSEMTNRSRSSAVLHLERIRGLLSGDSIELAGESYNLTATHIGIVGVGEHLGNSIAGAAKALRGQLLAASPEPRELWAWIGVQGIPPQAELAKALEGQLNSESCIAVGEPAVGLPGWRLTHRQAAAAVPLVQHGEGRLVFFSSVAQTASALNDDLLRESLGNRHLEPLSRERDGGTILRETLRAYFAADRNVSSAAAALGLRRHTITNRLRTVERRLECDLPSCASELELALKLEPIIARQS